MSPGNTVLLNRIWDFKDIGCDNFIFCKLYVADASLTWCMQFQIAQLHKPMERWIYLGVGGSFGGGSTDGPCWSSMHNDSWTS